MIKLKKLLKESIWGERKFGEPLPTVKDYKEAYNKKHGIEKEKLEEAQEKFGVKYNDNDHYEIDRYFQDTWGVEVGYSESFDLYGWKDNANYTKAVKELNKYLISKVKPLYQAQEKFAKESTNFYKEKEKIFNKWRKTDGSSAGD